MSSPVITTVGHPPSSADLLATLGVSHEQFRIHQERFRRSLHPSPTLLNLPPLPAATATAATTRPPRPAPVGHGACVMSQQVAQTPDVAANSLSASLAKGKAKQTLDAFMDSRQATHDSDSSGSDSELSLIKMLALPPHPHPSSSPPSSSPLHTPPETSPLRSMHAFPSSPTPRPKRLSAARPDAPPPSYVLPPGPYSREKPSWSLAALIGQAITAAHSGALPLNDIYTYISTVYPHYNRRDQPWMSSVRHSLSVNEAFERVPDQDGASTRKARKGVTRLKGGLWRIKPGHEPCFEGGNFVRKGAKGAGPGKNSGARKRAREDDEGRKDKKRKVSDDPIDAFSQPSASTSSHPTLQTAASSSRHSASPGEDTSLSTTPVLMSSHGTAAPESLLPSHYPSSPASTKQPLSGPGMSSPGSPDLPLALTLARPSSRTHVASSLEPGFELDMKRNSDRSSSVFSTLKTRDRQRFTHPLSPKAGPSDPSKAARLLFPPPFSSSPLPGSSSSPMRPSTPPTCRDSSATALSPARTPMSHRGLHMSPSRSLAHYKSSLEPEWKSMSRPTTPLPRDRHGEQAGDEAARYSTPPPQPLPKQPSFAAGDSGQASPFRTPARAGPSMVRHGRGYDPYDPNTLLADELASIQRANEPQESPGGFFGKEGRKLLYESPSLPGQSDWRFRDEI